MPKISELPQTQAPSLDHAGAFSFKNETHQLTITQVLEAMNLSADNINFDNDNTIAAYINNLSEIINTNTSTIATLQAELNTIISSGISEARLKKITINGKVEHFATDTALPGFLIADGTEELRSQYPDLWANVSTNGHVIVEDSEWHKTPGRFSNGDGSTTFRLPDYRGVFPRYLGTGSSYDSDRVAGSFQGDAIRNIKGNIGGVISLGASGVVQGKKSSLILAAGSNYGTYEASIDASTQVPTGPEVTVKNVTILPLICFKLGD